jgi:very-short-patch-repair endonuclease
MPEPGQRILSVAAGNLAVMPHLAQFDQAAITETLRRQQGIVTRGQAHAHNMTEKSIRYRTRPDGPWQVVLPGIYLDRRGPLTGTQRAIAAYLYAGKAIGVTGSAALAWHGVPVDPSEFVDVLVPIPNQKSNSGFARLRRTSVLPRVAYTEGAVTYAPVDRAIVDAARQMTDMADVRAVVAAGVQRGKVHVMQLAAELDRGPVAGSARLRIAIAEVADGVRSTAEADLRKIVVESRLPAPLYNARLYVGSDFLASPDAWWPHAGVAAEVDSKAWHLAPAEWERTLARHDRMTAQGILVLRFPPQRLRAAKREVAREIKSALATSRGPLPHIVTQRAM